MVIPDWTTRPPAAKREVLLTEEPPLRLARPLDRLGAAIIDVAIFLVPVYLLLSAPLKRDLTMSFILGSEPDFMIVALSMFMVGAALLLSYQTICHYFFGATLGKKIFDLRVEPMFAGEQLTVWDHGLRSFLWLIEMLCFGLPWLAVFSNSKRRPMHDRICDTVVVTRSPAGVAAPHLWERHLVRAFFAFLLGIFALIVTIQVSYSIRNLRAERALASIVERDLGDCEVVSEAVGSVDEDSHARLKKAMTLYAAGLADRSCLESEVEGEIARQVPVAPITYLSQAFIYADEAEISNSYLDEVCEMAPGTVECAMSQLVTSWSDEDWESVGRILQSAPKGSGYMEVWALRHYMKQAQYAQALETLDELLAHREIAEFTLVQRVKALFNAYREAEATAAYQQAILTLPEDQAGDLGAWMCSQQLQRSCSARTGVACRQTLPNELTPEIDFSYSARALASVLSLECLAEKEIDYARFVDEVNDSSWKLFFQANMNRARGDRLAAGELFAKLMGSEQAPDLLRIEAARRWVSFAPRAQMERVVESWMKFKPREAWVKIGNFLFERLAETKNSELAIKVATQLAEDESLSPLAAKFLASLSEGERETVRRPAQAKEPVREMLESTEESP